MRVVVGSISNRLVSFEGNGLVKVDVVHLDRHGQHP